MKPLTSTSGGHRGQSSQTLSTQTSQLSLGEYQFLVRRPHAFGVVIEGVVGLGGEPSEPSKKDYLHALLLCDANRAEFLELIRSEGLVVCKNVHSNDSTYRKVRGKSSGGKLSQAEYYHHDGCSCPTKPDVVEIRLPHQPICRDVATAIAPFGDVIKAMLLALPDRLKTDAEIAEAIVRFTTNCDSDRPALETWDRIQGRTTRLVRRDMDAESCRSYFRTVDEIANAYRDRWEMGESRLMVNNHEDLTRTMQHRRAYQTARQQNQQNGSLVKRWTAEEFPASGS